MRAIVCKKVGNFDGLTVEEIKIPQPGNDEILVEVYASSVNYNSVFFARGSLFSRIMMKLMMKSKTKILGNDIAGKVVKAGKDVKKFKVGDEVYGDMSDFGFGAYAEYVCVKEEVLAIKPANISFEEAAVIPEAGLVALQPLLYKGRLKKGKKVLICGASGGVGSFAVQIAKAYGAEVTAVCSARNSELVLSLGADKVINYNRQDFVKLGEKYDFILATAGYRSIFDYKKVLKSRGVYVSTGGALKQTFQSMLLGPLLSKKNGMTLSSYLVKTNKDLDVMRELVESGKVKPFIEKCYDMTEIKEALEHYAGGHTRGKIVIRIQKEEDEKSVKAG
jgi:NADPH:quinone reductase-like Zn-dependent oxidoreductase